MSESFYAELRRLTPKVTGGLVSVTEETFKDAVVPAKNKVLDALVIVVVTKCEPCVKAYTKIAYQME